MKRDAKENLNKSERKMVETGKKLLKASLQEREITTAFLRLKFLKLAEKHAQLLERYETNGRAVKKQVVLESYGFDVEFFVKSQDLSKESGKNVGDFEKFKSLKISDTTPDKTNSNLERTR